ncbi:hypothetical protein LCGC14_3042610 [marine sediment metagenome]|uniref:Uncharacterized protein n=1 Tax=marine sediment metagenome TaxID=412755 RepID=A0A0F8WPM0_9ZZZZ
MSDNKYSPEPWYQPKGFEFEVHSQCTGPICETNPQSDANARRIVACINFLKGAETEYLERFPDGHPLSDLMHLAKKV